LGQQIEVFPQASGFFIATWVVIHPTYVLLDLLSRGDGMMGSIDNGAFLSTTGEILHYIVLGVVSYWVLLHHLTVLIRVSKKGGFAFIATGLLRVVRWFQPMLTSSHLQLDPRV